MEEQKLDSSTVPTSGVQNQEGEQLVAAMTTPLLTTTTPPSSSRVSGGALRARIQGMGSPLPHVAEGISGTFDAVRRGLGSGLNFFGQTHGPTAGRGRPVLTAGGMRPVRQFNRVPGMRGVSSASSRMPQHPTSQIDITQ